MLDGIDLPNWAWAVITVASLFIAMVWLDHLKPPRN